MHSRRDRGRRRLQRNEVRADKIREPGFGVGRRLRSDGFACKDRSLRRRRKLGQTHRSRFRERGRWRYITRRKFPKCALAAGIAITKDGLADEENVRFDFGLLDEAARAAGDTFQGCAAWLGSLFGQREFDLPEVEVRIAERDAVDVAPRFFSEAANEANVGFAIRIGKTQREDFVRGEFVAGEYAGTMKTEDQGASLLGKDAAGGIRTQQDDGNFPRNAAASA